MPTDDLSLDGEWQLAACSPQEGAGPPAPEDEWIAARVPGAVQHALVAAGRLENPLASQEAARNAGWVPRQDWLYRRTFDLHPDRLRAEQVALELDSVDTYADIWLNGVLIGRTDNMFRRWRLVILPGLLRPKDNELLVHLKSSYRMAAGQAEGTADIAVASNPTAHRDRSLVRRYQRSYNESLLNLGQAVIGVGLPQPVRLAFRGPVAVGYACFVTDALEAEAARAHVALALARAPGNAGPVTVRAALLDDDGAPAAQAEAEADGDALRLDLVVPDPRLWWPRGYGAPHLYTLRIEVLRQGDLLDAHTQRVGIKQVALLTETPDGRPDFALQVNGRRIHVRGGNIMPLDAIRGAADEAAYERLLRLVTHANMNLIRIWGGGTTETEAFLARCDALGIMLWQDFFLHSCTYPDHLPGFVARLEAEAADLIRTMRPHASLVLLCGGNEQQQGWDEWHWQLDLDRFYGAHLFNDVFPAIVAEQAPEIPYIPNSPHGGLGGQSPALGDTHTWGSLFNATKDPLFVTETCWHLDSYSRPETLAESMGLDADAPEWSDAGWRERWRQRTGLGLFTKYPYSSYHAAPTLGAYLHGLEIEQLEADYQALSLLRVRSPSCSGIIYWPLNKGGPLFGFGAIDYGQRPLMAHYGLRRLFADAALSLYRDAGTIRVMAANDGVNEITGYLKVTHYDVSGRVLGRWREAARIAPGARVRLFDADDLYARVRDRTRELVAAELLAWDGTVIARDRLFFCPLSEVAQPDPGLKAAITGQLGPGRWRLTVQSDAVVKLLCIASDRRLLFGDNYFSLLPGEPRELAVWAQDDAALDGATVTVAAQDAGGPPVTVVLGQGDAHHDSEG